VRESDTGASLNLIRLVETVDDRSIEYLSNWRENGTSPAESRVVVAESADWQAGRVNGIRMYYVRGNERKARQHSVALFPWLLIGPRYVTAALPCPLHPASFPTVILGADPGGRGLQRGSLQQRQL